MTHEQLKQHLLTKHSGLLSTAIDERDTYEWRMRAHNDDHDRFQWMLHHDHPSRSPQPS